MHNSIKCNTPCEMINITPLNPLISKCQIKVCYVGSEPNRNGSVITKEVAKEIANSLPGSPIVGYFNEKTQDFEEHNRSLEISDNHFKIIDTTKPYGFVSLDAKAWFQKFLDDGVEHEYLMTEGYLWTGAYPECQRVIERGNNQSMELDEKFLDASWTKDIKGDREIFIINEAIIKKLCILGEDYEPCFEGSQISKIEFSLGDDFKQELFAMMKELEKYLEKGGASMPEEEKVGEQVVVEEPVAEPEAPVAEEEEEITPVAEETAFAKEEEEEVCPECGKPLDECVCGICPKCGKPLDECECEEYACGKKKAKYVLEEVEEYVELQTQFAELQAKYDALVAEKESLSESVANLTAFKKTIEKKEKEQMIASFYMLSNEDKKEVIENIDNYSLDDIEAKLSIICVRNRVNFNLDEDIKNEREEAVTYNLSSVGVTSEPAWVKAIRSAKKD